MRSMMHATALAAATVFGATATAVAELTVLPASADNTLYESPAGLLSNGAGEWCFAGRTNQGVLRRGLLRFDLSGIPSNATITSVTLRLTNDAGQPITVNVSIHRATASWGEGSSDAEGNEGGGTAATPGDATWIHRSYSDSLWSAVGGDFARLASATTTVGPKFGQYVWSGPGAVADVQAWVDGSAENDGWLLRADESIRFGSARRFATRENALVESRPELSVEWSVVGDLDGDHLVGAADLAILLGQWGSKGSADLDGDGVVGAPDLGILLGGWSS